METNQLNANLDKNEAFIWVDIFRGLAALGVVLFHSRVDLWVGWNEIRLNPQHYSNWDKACATLSLPLPFLGSGVILFFIISGFSIHFPTITKREINWKLYALRRFLRIWPPYFFALLLCIVTEFMLKNNTKVDTTNSDTILKSIFMIQNYPPNPGQLNSNPSFWTLPVEMELYIIYPLFFMLIRLIGIHYSLLVVGILSGVALILCLSYAPWLEGNFVKYWIIWCSGAYLATIVKKNKTPDWKLINFVFLFLTLIVTVYLEIIDLPYVIMHFSWAVFYFLLLFICFTNVSPYAVFNKTILTPILWLGKISFSLYLIHFPVFKILGALWLTLHNGKPTNFIIPLVGTLIVIALAYPFYKYIEKPFHMLARNLGSEK